MKVFAIVVTYNASKWITKCLSSLSTSTLPIEIIVVDNDSSDDTINIITSTFDQVIIIKNNLNLGFGKANNLGIRYALQRGADYIFLLNQDAWILPTTIEELLSTSLKRPDFYVISPLHLNGAGTQLDHNFSVYISNAVPTNLPLNDLIQNLKEKRIFTVNFVNAAFWFLPRKCLEQIGGFDPIFYHYEEDADYVNRIHFHGFRVGIAPKAIGFHDRDQTPFNINFLPFKKRVKRKLSIYLLTLKNINQSLLYCVALVSKSFLKKNIACIVKLDFKNLIDEYLVFFQLFGKFFTVINHRNKSKKLHSSFL